MKLDPEVKNTSRDAAILVEKATVGFIYVMLFLSGTYNRNTTTRLEANWGEKSKPFL